MKIFGQNFQDQEKNTWIDSAAAPLLKGNEDILQEREKHHFFSPQEHTVPHNQDNSTDKRSSGKVE